MFVCFSFVAQGFVSKTYIYTYIYICICVYIYIYIYILAEVKLHNVY